MLSQLGRAYGTFPNSAVVLFLVLGFNHVLPHGSEPACRTMYIIKSAVNSPLFSITCSTSIHNSPKYLAQGIKYSKVSLVCC